jgi:flagellar protein FliO/FliZ
MTQGWLPIAILVILLAMLPIGLKWVQRRVGGTSLAPSATTKIVAAVAVGPHQRVITVETGPTDARVWLTLGVTAQHISCLHTAVAPGTVQADHAPDANPSGVVAN